MPCSASSCDLFGFVGSSTTPLAVPSEIRRAQVQRHVSPPRRVRRPSRGSLGNQPAFPCSPALVRQQPCHAAWLLATCGSDHRVWELDDDHLIDLDAPTAGGTRIGSCARSCGAACGCQRMRAGVRRFQHAQAFRPNLNARHVVVPALAHEAQAIRRVGDHRCQRWRRVGCAAPSRQSPGASLSWRLRKKGFVHCSSSQSSCAGYHCVFTQSAFPAGEWRLIQNLSPCFSLLVKRSSRKPHSRETATLFEQPCREGTRPLKSPVG